MTWLLAAMVGVGVFLVVAPTGRATMAVNLEPYLSPTTDEEESSRWLTSVPPGGLAAAFGGAFLGLLVAQGDLFLAGRSRSTAALALLGAAAGWVLWSMHQTNMRQRRATRLRYELPVVADALALHIVAGESISGAVGSLVDEMTGVASEELAQVLDVVESGGGLPEAFAEASRATAHHDATRLYETLSHAHMTGGRLADALGDLAIDYRAALERDLMSEGGKRAIATYGPVLVLMVPTALVFLIYPTLLGLRALSGTP
jgi:Flp pilus assembly protein TadB